MDNTRFALSAYVCWTYIVVQYWIGTFIFMSQTDKPHNWRNMFSFLRHVTNWVLIERLTNKPNSKSKYGYVLIVLLYTRIGEVRGGIQVRIHRALDP